MRDLGWGLVINSIRPSTLGCTQCTDYRGKHSVHTVYIHTLQASSRATAELTKHHPILFSWLDLKKYLLSLFSKHLMVFETFDDLYCSFIKSHSLWLKTNLKQDIWYSSNTKFIQLCKLTQLDFLTLFKWPRTSQSQSVKIEPCNVESFFYFIKAVMYSWIFFKQMVMPWNSNEWNLNSKTGYWSCDWRNVNHLIDPVLHLWEKQKLQSYNFCQHFAISFFSISKKISWRTIMSHKKDIKTSKRI